MKEDAKSSRLVAPDKKKLLEFLKVPAKDLVFLRQVHSDRILVLDRNASGSSGPVKLGPADGIILLKPGRFAVIRSADCLPILIVLPAGGQLCALHAGWRGTRERIAAKGAAEFLKLTGASPNQLAAAIGPCIRKCCYQVGEDVRAQYRTAGYDVDRLFSGRYLDLVEANRSQLQDLGISDVLDSGMCTSCRSDLFYSYRRERTSGRLWALAGFRASSI